MLKDPFPPLWNVGMVFGSGKVVSRKALEASGGKFDTKPPAQCGRYYLKEWLPKQRVDYRAKP